MDIAKLKGLDRALALIEKQVRQVAPFTIGNDEIDDQLVDYQEEITELSLQAANGELERDEFESQMTTIVMAMLLTLFTQGQESEMVSSLEAVAELEQERQLARESISDLADRIYSGEYSEVVDEETGEITQTTEEGEAHLESRLVLWVASAAGVYALGQLFAEATRMYIWNIGGTIEHCVDCLRLDSQIHSALNWRAAGWRPQSRRLECGGWRCDCSFQEVEAAEEVGDF